MRKRASRDQGGNSHQLIDPNTRTHAQTHKQTNTGSHNECEYRFSPARCQRCDINMHHLWQMCALGLLKIVLWVCGVWDREWERPTYMCLFKQAKYSCVPSAHSFPWMSCLSPSHPFFPLSLYRSGNVWRTPLGSWGYISAKAWPVFLQWGNQCPVLSPSFINALLAPMLKLTQSLTTATVTSAATVLARWRKRPCCPKKVSN